MDRDLDCKIAERLFGKTIIGEREWRVLRGGEGQVPHYSTCPRDAMAVVERMADSGFSFCAYLDADKDPKWRCGFTASGGKSWNIAGQSFATTVCLAALAALEASSNG